MKKSATYLSSLLICPLYSLKSNKVYKYNNMKLFVRNDVGNKLFSEILLRMEEDIYYLILRVISFRIWTSFFVLTIVLMKLIYIDFLKFKLRILANLILPVKSKI